MSYGQTIFSDLLRNHKKALPIFHSVSIEHSQNIIIVCFSIPSCWLVQGCNVYDAIVNVFLFRYCVTDWPVWRMPRHDIVNFSFSSCLLFTYQPVQNMYNDFSGVHDCLLKKIYDTNISKKIPLQHWRYVWMCRSKFNFDRNTTKGLACSDPFLPNNIPLNSFFLGFSIWIFSIFKLTFARMRMSALYPIKRLWKHFMNAWLGKQLSQA